MDVRSRGRRLPHPAIGRSRRTAARAAACHEFANFDPGSRTFVYRFDWFWLTWPHFFANRNLSGRQPLNCHVSGDSLDNGFTEI
jgi:hypothetical protein